MAGEGNRFLQAGYTEPKPFIKVNKQPMIDLVIEKLLSGTMKQVNYQLFLMIKEEYRDRPELRALKDKYGERIEFIAVPKTEGAACTVLFASQFINNEAPLLITNCDQIVDIDLYEGFISKTQEHGKEVSAILLFEAKEPKWSYAALGADGYVHEVAEKNPISDYATAGYYYFHSGQDYVDAAMRMIIHNDRVKNEFYVCPVYNHLLAMNPRAVIRPVLLDQSVKPLMHGLGTPEDLIAYLANKNKQQDVA